MDNQDGNGLAIKDLVVYHWRTKEEGKEEYARFTKTFKLSLKQMRYIMEPGGVERKLGPHPGPAPAQAAARREWREDKARYESKLGKIDDHFTAALSALESSFAPGSTPTHIIEKAIENPPEGMDENDWTYQRKFEAAWEALKTEYQPSTVVDLSLLKDQIRALSDQIPGGFDQFKSEFLRLHTEIMATRVPDAITPRELNNIVREGIKNPMVCTHVAYRIYSDDANAPWEATFEAVSKFLTFHRQKGIDPYGEAHGGPLVGHTSVAANSAQFGGEFKGSAAKRSMTPSRDGNGRFHKSQKTSSTETYSQSKRTSSTSHSTPTPDKSKPRNEAVCTRCWKTNTGHNFRNCPETKCICGQPLVADQPICFNYDNHPANAKFTDSVPKALARILEAYKRGAAGAASPSGQATPHNKAKPMTTRSKSRKGARAMAASVAEELVRRGVTGENLDHEA